MKCPHCKLDIHLQPHVSELMESKEGYWFDRFGTCPSCGNIIIDLIKQELLEFVDKTEIENQTIIQNEDYIQ